MTALIREWMNKNVSESENESVSECISESASEWDREKWKEGGEVSEWVSQRVLVLKL